MRVQQNTIEQFVIFLPALFLFGQYVHAGAAAALGCVWIAGRLVYERGYVADPAKRGLGFGISSAATLVLLLGGLVGGAVAALR
jgi:uncharacterized MAPEG superfamily protein